MTTTDKTIINLEETCLLCNNNETLASELVEMLKKDLPRQKKILVDALAKDDSKMIRDIIHQILGSCCYIALPQLKQAAEQLQDAYHSQQNPTQAQKDLLLDAINTAIAHAQKL